MTKRKSKTAKEAASDSSASLETSEEDLLVVNRPPHYLRHPSGVECITIAEHFNFCLGNALKYIWRAKERGNLIVDLKKARWYLDREIQRLTLEKKKAIFSGSKMEAAAEADSEADAG